MRRAVLLLMLAGCRGGEGEGRAGTSARRATPPAPVQAPATAAPDPWAEDPCISDAVAAAHVADAEAAARIGQDAGTTELVSSSCEKRVYHHGKTRIIVWKNDRGSVSHAITSMKTVTPACFAGAVERAATVVPYGAALVAAGKQRHGTRWTDPDIGAAQWVDCDAQGMPSAESVVTLLHEINHGLDKPGCVHEFTDATQLCFTLDDDTLPRRSIARITKLPHMAAAYRRAAEQVQDLYLGAIDQGPLGLLDELMAYRLSTEVRAADITASITSTDAGENRTLDQLPLMMDLTVRYFAALQKSHPAVHDANAATVRVLLDRAEQAHAGWLDALDKAKLQPTPYERAFFAAYRADRRRWLASCASCTK